MGEKKFTLLELHLDGDLQLGPSFGTDAEVDAESAEADGGAPADLDVDVESGGGSAAKPLLGLLALLLVLFAIKKFVGGGDEDLEEAIEDVVEE
jgi:hypothetical protein